MSLNFYDRSAVPVGEKIILEIQLKDSAGVAKDADEWPKIEIVDAASLVAVAQTSDGVSRRSIGQYKYDFYIPDGYTSGLWNDYWTIILDGYELLNVFDFTVNSTGSVEATGSSVPVRQYSLSDEDIEEPFNQEEIKGILRLRKYLRLKLRSTAYKPNGEPCPLVADELLDLAISSAMSEFNATPTLTTYGFDSNFIQTVCADVISQGAMLIIWAGQAVIEAGFEFTVNDNGVTYNPPPVSSTISSFYNTQLSDYRAKLKSIKVNLRPGCLGLGAGSLLVSNPRVRMLKNHRREKRII